ncbi:MAG: PAS domain S-box protein, partial [Pyrinomonadaceae bacterium]
GGAIIGIVGVSQDISERKWSEMELIESESRYRFLVEHASDGIHTYDSEGRLIDANARFSEMIGYTRQEFLNLRVQDLIPAEDLVAHPVRFDALVAGENLTSERRLRRKDGTLFTGEISGRMIQPGVFQASVRDVSERRRTQVVLDAQKEALEMVVSGAELAAVLTYLTKVVEDLSDNTVVASVLLVDADKRLRNGASPSLPEGYLAAIDGLNVDPGVGTCSSAAASGKVVYTPDISTDAKWKGLANLALELGLKAAWSMPILARNGAVLGTFGTYFREIREPNAFEKQVVEILARTAALAIEQKRSEADLRNSEGQLRLVADAIPLLVSFVDTDKKYRFVNRAYTQWFERTREDVVGRHLSDVLGAAAYDSILPEVEKALSGDEVVYDRSVPYRTGERFIHVNYIPQKDEASGKVTGFHSFVQDISERKAAEEAIEQSRSELERRVIERTNDLQTANRERVRILHRLVTAQEVERSRIARDVHDQLGQQMTVLRLKLEGGQKSVAGNDRISQQFDELREIARRLDSDIDFLAWKFRPAVLDDIGIVAALDEFVKQWSAHSGIEAEFRSRGLGVERLDSDIETNYYRITQEALNNIQKHANAEKVNVLLEPRDGGSVLIIEDDGVGFDVNEHAAARNGLGLTGMSERAALIGGTLEIESAQGEGTTVYINVPTSVARLERRDG